MLQDAEQKWRMVLSFWNLLDFFAFFPPLLEHLVAHSIRINFSMGHFDFRWFKILRWAGAAGWWHVHPCLPCWIGSVWWGDGGH